jgi:hypothetical protein
MIQTPRSRIKNRLDIHGNTIQDEKCQSFSGNPQAADYDCRIKDHPEAIGL